MNTKKYDIFIGSIAILAFILLLFETGGLFARHIALIQRLNLFILFIFIFDVMFRFVQSGEGLSYLRRNWFDLVVFIPFIQTILGEILP